MFYQLQSMAPDSASLSRHCRATSPAESQHPDIHFISLLSPASLNILIHRMRLMANSLKFISYLRKCGLLSSHTKVLIKHVVGHSVLQDSSSRSAFWICCVWSFSRLYLSVVFMDQWPYSCYRSIFNI